MPAVGCAATGSNSPQMHPAVTSSLAIELRADELDEFEELASAAGEETQ